MPMYSDQNKKRASASRSRTSSASRRIRETSRTGKTGGKSSPARSSSASHRKSSGRSLGATSRARAGVQTRRKSPGSPAKKNSPKKRAKLVRRFLFLGLLLGGVIFWASHYYSPTVAPGVHINGYDMSGKSEGEVVAILEEQIRSIEQSLAVTLRYGDKTWILTQADFDVESPIEHTTYQAMQIARTGSLFQRVKEGWQARKSRPNYQASLAVKDANLDERIARIASEIDVAAVDAAVEFDADNGKFVFSDEADGRLLNQQNLKEVILSSLEKNRDITIELSLETVHPSVTKAELSKATNRISFFETEVKGSQNRIDNVKLALEQFNGMVIQPGQTVSFNETTGERSEANGYKEAPGINADKGLEDTLGGGVCQASTTLYNAALMANCKIDERHRHSFPSSYVKKGFDAMVNWPNKDFQFTNQSDYPIFIRTHVGKKDGVMVAQVWFYGMALENGVTLSRESVIVSETEKPEPTLIEDTSGRYAEYVTYNDEAYIAVASRAGMTVETYLVTKDKDGNVLERTKLYTDEFPAITGKHYYGTQSRPAGERPVARPGNYLLPNATYVPVTTPKPDPTQEPISTPAENGNGDEDSYAND